MAVKLRDKIRSELPVFFEDLTRELDPYKEAKTGTHEFIVDGDKTGQVEIRINYPGRTASKRKLQLITANSVLWENLYDFAVVPYFKGQMLDIRDFTYRKVLDDFEHYKRGDEDFWNAIVSLYKHNTLPDTKFAHLKGIDPVLFLYVLKWLWAQEDLNYRVNHKDFKCPTKYMNQKRGVGRGKFFASLLLVRSGYFTAKDCIKITSLY